MGKKLKLLSFIIPCYNSADSIAAVVDEIRETTATLACLEYEIILVNDASPDGVYGVIKQLCASDPRIKAIDLSKNFGQHSAILAGIREANGDLFVFLDDDGQTPVREVGKLLSTLSDDCDIAMAEYQKRQFSVWRNLGSKINNWMAEVMIGKPKGLSLTSFFVCKRFIAEELTNYQHSYPYLAGLLLQTSNKIKNVPVFHRERISGQSGYTLRKLLSLWVNGFTAFSIKPLRVATISGAILAIIGFIFGVYTILTKFFNPEVLLGYSSTMAALLFIGGMIMLMLGLIGEYVGRIFMSVNNAPQYVVRERINSSSGCSRQRQPDQGSDPSRRSAETIDDNVQR
jgi:undecaprenyl-phosphate 4-deoxy-4-formamido-L-arabinose transferase